MRLHDTDAASRLFGPGQDGSSPSARSGTPRLTLTVEAPKAGPIMLFPLANSATVADASERSAPRARGARKPGVASARAKREAEQPLGGWRKRMLDIAVALITLALLLPIMLMIALIIKLTMGGPVIYAQTRVGQGGRTFRCLKFRTMVPNSDAVLARLLASDRRAAQEWREARKLRHDPRITPLGHMLRKSSLDELPQLINVLRGEMSCVGPRPVPADELEKYGARAEVYKRTRPGLTGLWQTSGRNLRTYDERVSLDCAYVQGWSLQQDVLILLRTVPAVMRTSQTM